MANVMTTMRAMRRLRPDPVPDDLVRELIEAAMCAPSAGHQQGQVFIVVTDRARIARLATVWRTVVDMYEGWMGKADPRYGIEPLIIRTWDAVHYQRDHFDETADDEPEGRRRMRDQHSAFVDALLRERERRECHHE